MQNETLYDLQQPTKHVSIYFTTINIQMDLIIYNSDTIIHIRKVLDQRTDIEIQQRCQITCYGAHLRYHPNYLKISQKDHNIDVTVILSRKLTRSSNSNTS